MFHNATHNRDLERFTRLAERLRGDVDQHANQFDLALRAIRSFFTASELVEYEEFLDVAGAIDLQNKMPGVDGVIYVERVAKQPEALHAFRQTLADQGLQCMDLPIADSQLGEATGQAPRDELLLVKYIQLPDQLPEQTGYSAGLEFGTDRFTVRRSSGPRHTGLGQIVPRNSFMSDQNNSHQYLYMLPCFATKPRPDARSTTAQVFRRVAVAHRCRRNL